MAFLKNGNGKNALPVEFSHRRESKFFNNDKRFTRKGYWRNLALAPAYNLNLKLCHAFFQPFML